MKFKILNLLVLLTISCKSSVESSYEIIDLKNAFENVKSIDIDNIAKSYEYINLETKDECLAGAKLKVYNNDQFLIAIDRTQILVFDRKNGRFIRKIGQLGDGPVSYSRTYSVMPFNEEKNTVYAGRNRKRYEYSLDGQLINTITVPGLISEFGNIDESNFAAFLPNYQGNEKNKIIIFNEEGSVLKSFPNYLTTPKPNGFIIWNPHSWFYRLDKQLYFYELFNDTLFHVTTNALTPKYIFSMGLYSLPYEMQTLPNVEFDNHFFIKTLMESSRYLFCAFDYKKGNYTAVYDKKQMKTIVNDFIAESGNGFIKNTNDFVPLELSSINGNNELVFTIDSYKIKQWFRENPGKVNQLPEYLRSLENIKETDNPVIMIARLKQ